MKTTYIKLIAFLCIGTFFVSCSKTKEQKEFTTAEYEAAAAQMDNGLNDLVYNQVSEITFTDSTNFRYATNTKDGKKYIMVDAISKTKKTERIDSEQREQFEYAQRRIKQKKKLVQHLIIFFLNLY